MTSAKDSDLPHSQADLATLAAAGGSDEFDRYADELTRPGGRRWSILHTRARQEKAVARELAARGVSFFLPSFHEATHHGHGSARRKVDVERVVFPSYVFAFARVEEVYGIDRAGRLAGIIRVSDQERLQDELRSLGRALATAAGFDPYPHLVRGTPVVVRSGPLEGVRGVVSDRLAAGRLILEVGLLGQAITVELAGAEVQALAE